MILRPLDAGGTPRFVLKRVLVPGTGGGGSGGGGPVDPPSGPLEATPILYGGPIGTSRPRQTVEAAFGEFSYVGTEGTAISVDVYLSQGVPVEVSIPIEIVIPTGANAGASTLVTVPALAVFAAGATSTSVSVSLNAVTPPAGATYRYVGLQLAPGAGFEGGLGGGPSEPLVDVVVASGAFGPALTLVYVYDTGATVAPQWTWAGVETTGNPPIPEPPVSTIIQIPIVVNRRPDDDLVFAIAITPGTAVAGTHYELLTPTVTIDQASTSAGVRIRLLNENSAVPPIASCTVTATLSSGTAVLDTNGVSSWQLNIADNDASTQPVLSMQAAVLQVAEGAPPVTVFARLTQSTLQSAAVVPVTLSGSAVAGQDYSVVWASGVPGQLVIPPSVDVFPVLTVTALQDGFADPGEALVVTLGTPPSPMAAGLVTATTINIVDVVTLGVTEAAVQLGTGLSTNMVQGLIAVVPPSATLPELMMDGRRAQVVGMSRNGDGLWTSAYVYGLVDRDTLSAPQDTSAAITLVPVSASVTEPTGAFEVDPGVTFRLRAANVTDLYERSSNTGFIGGWTGPGAGLGWDQVGADIVRETWRPRWLARAGTSSSDFDVRTGVAPATDRCCMVDLVVTQVRGMEMFIYSGALLTGVMDFDEDARVPSLQSRTAPGEVYIRSFAAEVPAGWTPVVIDAHPGLTVVGQTITFRASGATDELLTTCREYQFRFAIVKSGGNVSSAAATQYLARRNIATWVGALGVTTNAIMSDFEHPIVDLHRANVQIATVSGGGSPANGWRRPMASSDGILGTAASGYSGTQAAWVAGTTEFAQGLQRQRAGMWHPFGPAGMDAAGGVGIDGSAGFLPCAGWWRKADITRMAVADRLRLRVMSPHDPQNGGAWWWRVAVDGVGAQAGQRVLPFQYAPMTDPSLFRPVWFWSPNDVQPTSWDASQLPLYERAPTTRPWNTFETADDPAAADKRSKDWGTWGWSHMSRVRNVINDGWWGCREPMARRLHEACAAFATRAYSPTRQERDSSGTVLRLIKPFNLQTSAFGDFALMLTGPARQGRWTIAAGQLSANAGEAGPYTFQNHRTETWPLASVMSYRATGTNAERAHLAGQTPETGVAWWAPFMAVHDHVIPDSGSCARVYFDVTGNNPYSARSYGLTNEAEQVGAWKDGLGNSSNVTYDGPDRITGHLMFHFAYWMRALRLFRSQMPEGSVQQTVLDRCFAYYGNQVAGARVWTQERGIATWPKFMPVSVVGGGVNGSAAVALSGAVVTPQELRDGVAHWRLIGGSDDGSDQLEKVLSGLYEVYRVTGDLGVLNLVGEVFERPDWPRDIVVGGVINQERLTQLFQTLLRGPSIGWEAGIGSSGGGNLAKSYNGFFSWMTPMLAWLQQLGA